MQTTGKYVAFLSIFLIGIILPAVVAHASTPSSGTLTVTSGPVTYTAGPFTLANPTPVPLVDSGPECSNPQQPCDDFALTVTLPSNYTTTNPNKLIQFKMSWTDSGTGASDYDLYIYAGTVTNTDGSQTAQAQSASSANPEVTTMRTFNGTKTFTVKVVPYTPTGETVHVEVSLIDGPASGGGTGFGGATPTAPGVPRYQNFFPPKGSPANGSAGEFSIGFDPRTGNIMTLSDIDTFRVTPPEHRNPALPASGPAEWTDVSPSIVGTTTLDPILFTDQATGRTFESMQTTGAEALFGYTDDDGTNWIQASAAPPNGGADHETVGAGPYPSLFPVPNPLYPSAVYYCSQDVVGPAMCQRSDDGGTSFGTGVPIYEGNGITDCGGLHGHVKVGPDGAVYVPVPQCGSQQGGVVSLDAGVTWSQFLIPGSQSFAGGSTDPSIAIDQNNTAYMCYVDGQGAEHHAHVAVSHDHGKTWINDTDIGAPVGAIMAVFPEAVAGSPGRAACGFLGSNAAGDHESLDYPGFWYLFIATTYDGGKTWTTVNATPNDPVQGAGGIWNSGGGNENRNLLDFNEVTMDSHGNVLFGYDDGCVTATCISDPTRNDFVAYERVARQTGGKPLLSQYDPVEPTTPKAPYLEGTRTSSKVDVDWNPPDNGGADISAYKILRSTSSGTETLIATVSGDKTSYEDAGTDPSVAKYFYEVVAVNAQGDGPVSNEIALSVTSTASANPCDPPGVTLLTDASGDSLSGTPGTDLKSFQLSQPYASDGNIKLRFQINTDPGQEPQPPQSYWYVSFKEPDGSVHGVRMVFKATSPSTPTFESYVSAPNSSGGVDGRFVKSGSEKPADPSSFYDAAKGTVVIVVPISDLGLSGDDIISGFNSAVVQSASTPAGGAAETLDEMPDGLAYQGSFAISSNAQCAPNNPPFAVMHVTPDEGTAPLDVTFDASGSYDSDPGDSVADYRFNFGDGSPAVTQSTPVISHTYQNAGDYNSSLTVTDTHNATSRNAAAAVIEVRACFEDNDPHIAYDKGWHTVNDSAASGGTYHLLYAPHAQHGLGFTFDLGSASGTLKYYLATSSKGGSADIYLDGTYVQTVNYHGDSGSMHQPVFGTVVTINVSGQGSHTVELRNVSGAAYVDRFCIAGASSDATPSSNPGSTETRSASVSPGEQITDNFTVPTRALSIDVLTDSGAGASYELAVLDPAGSVVGTVNASANGVAELEIPVSVAGIYVVQIVNQGSAPIDVWSAATPQVAK